MMMMDREQFDIGAVWSLPFLIFASAIAQATSFCSRIFAIRIQANAAKKIGCSHSLATRGDVSVGLHVLDPLKFPKITKKKKGLKMSDEESWTSESEEEQHVPTLRWGIDWEHGRTRLGFLLTENRTLLRFAIVWGQEEDKWIYHAIAHLNSLNVLRHVALVRPGNGVLYILARTENVPEFPSDINGWYISVCHLGDQVCEFIAKTEWIVDFCHQYEIKFD